jgi:hypothetical protein
MKELFIINGAQRLFRPSLHQMTLVVAFIAFIVLLNGCASAPYVSNIQSTSELKKDQKILAGRFACFDNDAPVHCTKSGFLIYFNKDGDLEAKLFTPDDGGYVYIAVTEGYYDFARFVKGGKDGSFVFDLASFPVILVRTDDSVVNFGTFEVRFAQSSGGGERGTLQVIHIGNYAVTRSEIASRLGKLAGAISDGRVEFLQRARK